MSCIHTHTNTHRALIGALNNFNLIFLDPLSRGPQKAMELIANNLQKQYERWQPRARYKQLLDPTTDDVRKLCVALRKNAKVRRGRERVNV